LIENSTNPKFTGRSNLMNESRLERLSPLSGAAAVLIMVVGILLFNFYEFLPSAEKIADFLNSNAARVYTGGYIASVSTFFLIWFAGSVRSSLIRHEGGTGSLSNISFGGGIAAAVVLGISFVGIFATGLRAGALDGLTPVGAVTMYDFWTQLSGQLFGIFMAVFISAASVVSLRTGLFPAWFGWASLIIAFGLLTPFAYAVLGFAILWLLVVSIWLYIKDTTVGEPRAIPELA
jgi:hypothetical protein